ncbi:MAG: GTPase [archaeon]
MQPKNASYATRRSSLEIVKDYKKKYPDIAIDVIRISDIVLEICDARFIKESRNKKFEDLVIKSGKKLMYVLNKADLVDMEEVARKLELHELQPYFFISCKTHYGISNLRDMIKIEVKRADMKYKRAHVGVIGYPNIGKSSVINLLAGKPVAKTAAEAGFTKGMQKIRLAKDIIIIDTPGVIPQEEMGKESRNTAKHAKINVKTWDTMKSPDIAVFDIFKKHPGLIERFYEIDSLGDFEVLIEKLGRKNNFLKKGDVIDVDRTTRLILRDWQSGNILKEES